MEMIDKMSQNKSRPKVSIIIPVYNGTNYMKEAIDSALEQTYENLEVIVVNDGSQDDGATEAVAKSYGDRIRYFYKENGGVSSALNCGIANMTGEYFAWLSHDDLYTPNRIEDAVNLLEEHDLLGKKYVGFTGGYVIDADGRKLKNLRNCFDSNRTYSSLEVLNLMSTTGTLYGCSFLIPHVAFVCVGDFDESLRYSQDALMWYRIFLDGYGLIADGKQNVMSRMHKGQVSLLKRDLFAHDALVIAKLLAEPLAKVDPSGLLLFKYIKRLTKYECVSAVDYLMTYACDQGCLRRKDQVILKLHSIWGFFRYKFVKILKQLVLFRR